MRRPKSVREAMPGLGRILRRFLPFAMDCRGLAAGSLGALIGATMLRLLEPWPIKFVFDAAIGKHAQNRDQIFIVLGWASLALIGITAARAFLEYANTVGFAAIGNRVLARVRAETFRHLQDLSLSYHHSSRAGDLVVRVINDVNMLKDVVVSAALPLAASVLVVVGMLSLMFAIEWRLTLACLAVLPPFLILSQRLGSRIKQVARAQRKREGAMASTAAEAISAIKTVKALNLESHFSDAFSAKNQESQRADVKGAKLAAKLERGVDIMSAISTAIVLWLGGVFVFRGELTPGTLLVFLTYVRRLFNPLQDFAKYTGRLAKATAAGERLLDVLDTEPAVRDREDARPLALSEGRVQFDRITFAYEGAEPALTDFSLEVRPGIVTAVVGPSGAGKSTLLSLMLRLYEPQSGQITIDCQDLNRVTLESLRSNVAIVLQDNTLFSATVLENILHGSVTATAEEAVSAARLANAHEFIENLPDGYASIVGERGATLSQGQRQRIAIARAAVRNAPILILDEPTSGLDEKNAQAVMEAVLGVSHGRTTLVVTHDMSLASRADFVAYVDQGRLIERGTHGELMSHNGAYAHAYRLQQLGGSIAAPI